MEICWEFGRSGTAKVYDKSNDDDDDEEKEEAGDVYPGITVWVTKKTRVIDLEERNIVSVRVE